MSVTLKGLAYKVIDGLTASAPSRDSDFDIDDAILAVRQASSEIVSAVINKTGEISFHYIYRGEVDVLYNSSQKYSYSNIPYLPLQLSENEGVKEIHPLQCPTDPFIPIRSGELGLVSEIINNEVLYYPEKDKVIYWRRDNKKLDQQKVVMKIVAVAPDTLDIDDVFYLAPDLQASVIKRAQEIMIPVGERDNINNSNPTK